MRFPVVVVLGLVAMLAAGASAIPVSAAETGLEVSATASSDGTAPWDDADPNGHNGIVRSGDRVSYQVTVTPTGTAHGVVVKVAASPASVADGVTLTCGDTQTKGTCDLGDVSEKQTLTATLVVPKSTAAGTKVELVASADSEETADAVAADPVVTTVVARSTPSQNPDPDPSPTGGSTKHPTTTPTRTTAPDPTPTHRASHPATTPDRPRSSGHATSGGGGGSGGGSGGGARPPSLDGRPTGSALLPIGTPSAGLPSVAPSPTVPEPLVATYPNATTSPVDHRERAAGAVTPSLRASPFVAAAVFILALALTRQLLRRRSRRR